MNKNLLILVCGLAASGASAQDFTAGNIVVLQTSGTASKASSAVTLKEYSTTGTAGITVNLPTSGPRAFQSGGAYGGSEGFLTTSTDGKYLVVGGYGTAASYSDITGTTASTVPRVVGTIAPSGFYLQTGSSSTSYSANDIRGAVSDGTNFWAAGASVASADGINYFGPGTPVALASGTTPPKAYGIRIFDGQIYYSTQKSGPTSTSSQLGVFALGTGSPTSGTVTVSQVINTGGTAIPQDFSFNTAKDICYIAISLNTAVGGIQKWTRSGTTWTLAYTLGTGATNVGAYGLVVDYSGTNPVIYATTFESAGNRVIKVTDNGTAASATITTLVAATSNVYNKGISFAPVASGTPLVNLTVSADTASEAAASVITVTASSSATVTTAQTVTLSVSGTGITAGDYTLSATTITIPAGASSGSVTFTVKDDILGEGTETASLKIGSFSSGIQKGMDTVKTITIADNDGNNIPVVGIQTDSTTNYIDAGVTVAPASPFPLSGVINDPTDPGTFIGINFLVSDAETAGTGLSLRVTTSDTDVVPDANLVLSGTDSIRNLKIIPKGVGYADITLTVSDGMDSSTYLIKYAASAASVTPAATYWHTGLSDGSDAYALDNDYYLCGDDELNLINVYSRNSSGMPLASWEYTSFLALPAPSKPEVDVEAAAPSYKNSGRVYWLGSMSNGKSPFDSKPNRDRIFAAKVSGTGSATAFSFVGYAALKTALISWGDANGYNFTASAAAGVDSKLPSGFAAEGMVFGPDSTTLYIGLRAPLVPVTTRNKALIAPVKNFETWFNDGTPSGSPVFGTPIELDLGGRAIRDISRMSNGTYIIVAGNAGGAPLKGAIYKWSGKQTDAPVKVAAPAGDTLNMEGVMEMKTAGSLQVITDKGDDVYYNDGIAAKDFGDLIYRKFRSDIFSALDLSMPTVSVPELASADQPVQLYPNPSTGTIAIAFYASAAATATITVTDMSGRAVWQQLRQAQAGNNTCTAELGSLPKGMYLLHISTAEGNYNQKLVLQ